MRSCAGSSGGRDKNRAPVTRAGKDYRASALLEDRADAGLLFRELLVSGAEIIAVPARGEPRHFDVGGPAPRDVTTGYLHCTGDLVGPPAASPRGG